MLAHRGLGDPEAPPDLVPRRRLDPLAFVDARIDTRQAVVGQQVTLTIYAHGAQGLFQEAPGAREPSHPDFLAQRLVEDGSRQPVYQYAQDGQRWIAVKVRERVRKHDEVLRVPAVPE